MSVDAAIHAAAEAIRGLSDRALLQLALAAPAPMPVAITFRADVPAAPVEAATSSPRPTRGSAKPRAKRSYAGPSPSLETVAIREQIRQLLAQGPRKAKELVDAIQASDRKVVDRALKTLVKRGEIVSVKFGHYQLGSQSLQ